MSDEQVLKMPVRRFWMMSGNIGRIKADDDMRSLRNGIMQQTSDRDALERYQQELRLEIGTVVIKEEKLDRRGLQELKKLM